jgi:autotransporter-associated beta strand protein/T5SS/PEP-CTERM-associated repeat protein
LGEELLEVLMSERAEAEMRLSCFSVCFFFMPFTKGTTGMNKFFKLFCFLAVTGLLTAVPLWGEENRYWGGTVSQDFSDPANWTTYQTNGTDPAGNRLFINQETLTYPIFTGTGYSGATLNVWDLLIGTDENWSEGVVIPTGSGRFDQTGGTINLNYALRIGGGGAGSGNGAFYMSGGVFNKNWNGGDLELGIGTGHTGTMELSNSAIFNLAYNYFQVGRLGGTGNFTMKNTSQFTMNGDLNIGIDPGSIGTVDISGSSKFDQLHGWLDVGSNFGNGTMTVSGTAQVNVRDGYLFVGRGDATGLLNLNGGSINALSGTIIGERTGTATLNLNGGVYSTPWVQAGWGDNEVTVATLNLNGGTLRATSNNTNFINVHGAPNFHVKVQSGGAIIDTNSFNITISAALEQDGASAVGITKKGLGNLTLNKATTVTGAIEVQAGTLTLATGVNGGGTPVPGFSFPAGTPNNITVRPGATFANDSFSISTMGALNANLILDAKSTISAGLDGGDFLNPIQVQDVSAGTTGQPVIVKLNGILPSHGLTFLGGGSVLTYATEGGQGAVPTFLPWLDSYGTKEIAVQDDHVGSVNLVLTDSATTRGWAKDVPGSWNNSANWLGGVPDATDAKAWFTQTVVGSAPVAVSLDSSVTVSSMMFNTGAGTGYTISSPGAQTITLQSTIAANTHIEVVSGDHVINSNIVMADGGPIVNVAAGHKLTLNGVLSNLSGPAGISFEGNGEGKTQSPTYGTLELTGLNTFTGPVVMSTYGRLAIDKLGALGQSSVDPANLVINGFLAYTGTATTPTTVVMDRGYTAAGVSISNAYTDCFLNGIEVADPNINLKITGQVASTEGWTSAFRKTGPGTLTYANTGVNNVLGSCGFQVGQGTVVFESGTYTKGRNDVQLLWGSGHFIVGDPDSAAGGYSPTLKVLNAGTVVNTGGDLAVAGFAGSSGSFFLDAGTMNVGSWTIIGQDAGATGNATISNGGVFNTAGQMRIGQNGGTGHLTMGTNTVATVNNNEIFVGFGTGGVGYLTLNNNSKMTINGYVQIGRGMGTGTLDMTGSSTMNNNQEFRIGISGGTGTLNMSGTSVIDSLNLGWIGANRDWDGNGSALSNAYINLSGSAKMIAHTWETCMGRSGGHAEIKMNGDNPDAYCQINSGDYGGRWTSFGRDSGSTATVEMKGYSLIRSNSWTEFGTYDASCTVNMYDHATVNTVATYDGGDFNAGSYGTASYAEINMHNSANISNINGKMEFAKEGTFKLNMFDATSISTPGWMSVGTQATGNGTIVMGLAGGTDTASLHCGDWFNFGGYGGYCKLTMNAHSIFSANTQGTIAEGDGGKADVFLNDYAEFNGAQIRVGGGNGAIGNVTMTGHSKMTSTAAIILAAAPGSTAKITLSDYATMSTAADQRINLANDTTTVLTLDASGHSVISSNVISIANWTGGDAVVNLSDNASMSAPKGIFVSNRTDAKGVLNMKGNSTVSSSNLQVAWGGKGVVNVGDNTGTATLTSAQIDLGYSDDTDGKAMNADATINLNRGGAIVAGSIRSRTSVGVPLSSVLNFDGGLLQASASSTTFIANTAGSLTFNLNVLGNGAIIDTNTFDDTIVEPLKNGVAGTDGGLKKIGLGTLTLAADPTYTGNTTVNAGALTVGNLTHSANVYVASTGTLNATSIVTGTLTIGGPALAAASSASVTAVPEPSTIVLLVLAGLGALLAWRRK